MTLVSITAVDAFDAVGSILVVALMIVPPASAYLLPDSLPRTMELSALIGVASAIGGYWVTHTLDAAMTGTLFGLALLFAPERGLVAAVRRRAQPMDKQLRRRGL